MCTLLFSLDNNIQLVRRELCSLSSLLFYHCSQLNLKGLIDHVVCVRCICPLRGCVRISQTCEPGVISLPGNYCLLHCCSKPRVGYCVLPSHHVSSSPCSYVLCSKIREKNIWQTIDVVHWHQFHTQDI